MSAVALPLVALALAMTAAWLTAAALYPAWAALARRRLGLARWALLIAVAPWFVGAALAAAALVPGDPHLDQLFGCHCATSMPGWLHLCPVHPGEATLMVPAALLALIALLPGRLRALAALAAEPRGMGGGAEPMVLDLPRRTAFLLGWRRPTLVVDRQLWSALSPAEQRAVIAHERAHLARRDPLVLMALSALVSVGPRASGVALMRAWLARAEVSADADAASALGDPVAVAEALLRCARLESGATLRLAWTGGGVEGRVRALLDAAAPGAGRASSASRPDMGTVDIAALIVAAGLTLAATPWLHHQLEHLLNLSL